MWMGMGMVVGAQWEGVEIFCSNDPPLVVDAAQLGELLLLICEPT